MGRAFALGVLCPTLLALTPSATAQASRNVDLLGRLSPSTLYTDVWGYAAPDGREYALLALAVGTSVIDCTDPTAPVERAMIPGPVAPLRDIKTLGRHAYVVNESGGGLQIIDLVDPDAPMLVGTWGASSFGHAHNLAIDQDTGRIYVVGTDVGMVVFDASANPTAPPVVGVYGGPFVTEYVHDLHVQDGLGHAAMVWTGNYRVLDVTTWPIPTLAAPFSAGRATHNTWANESNTVVVTTDEQEGGLVQLWDVRVPAAPKVLAAYSPNTVAVPHNAHLVDGLCHVAWFTEGYRVLDVSDPADPVEIGYYDMYAGPSGTQSGAFGCYPFQPSAVVYVSDRTQGLYVLRPHRLRIRHAPLPDTEEEARPYRVEATIASRRTIETASLFWSVDGETFREVRLRPAESLEDFVAAGTPGRWVGAIPAQPAPSRVTYYLTATDHGGGLAVTPSTGVRRFDVGRRVTVWSDDFEGADAWTHGGVGDDWERGTPLGLGGTSRGVAWTDPWFAHSGTSVWGNDLGLAGSDGAYATNVSSWLQSPTVPTSGVEGLRLSFRRWLTVEDASSDHARVRVNGQVVWESSAAAHHLDFEWTEVELDVSSVLDGAPTATVRFELSSDGDMEVGGWQIDDVELFALVASTQDG